MGERVIEENYMFDKTNNDGEGKRSDNEDFFAGREEEKETEGDKRENNNKGKKVFTTGLDRSKRKMKEFIEGDCEGLDQV
jgi:hypothetical protein